MCIDIEPNLWLSQKAIDNLATMFEFFDMVRIGTANSCYTLINEPKFNKHRKFFCGEELTTGEDVIIPLEDVKYCRMKGRHKYDDNGERIDLD